MAKDVEDRYQTAKDMLIDLRNLRKQIEGAPVAVDQRHRGTDNKRALAVALLVLAFFIAVTFGVNIWRRSRAPSAVPVTTTSTAVASLPERALTYWITVRQTRGGKQKTYTLAGEINFELKDEIRLNVRSPEAGYLYVLNEGPRTGSAAPEFIVLFPSPTANEGSSLLTANRELQIPAATWFSFDADEGIERVWLIFSKEAIPEFEALKKFANPRARGRVTDPAENKRVQDFLLTQPTSKPEVERGDTLTTLKTTDRVLVYPVKLEHH
jgi:hypothetical protein